MAPAELVVIGSIATDYLMAFPGRISEQLVADRLDSVSLSFLVDELEIRPGGVAANIAFGLGSLGLRPLLVGAVGEDFAEYRRWLEDHRVDTGRVRVSRHSHTSRFLCTTDADQNQIATFYSGAMAEVREIDLAPIVAGLTAPLVVISPSDPEGMLHHSAQCREFGLPFVADPSQQIARMDGAGLRGLVDGAAYLFTNEYEHELLVRKTGWSDRNVLARVGTWVTTFGANGVQVVAEGAPTLSVAAVPAQRLADPTGVGDALRAGYLAGTAWGYRPERCAQLGATLATLVIESVGPQDYEFDHTLFTRRFAAAYGTEAAAEVSASLESAAADVVALAEENV